MISSPLKPAAGDNLSLRVYQRLKTELFDFHLMPGDRFTESEVAARMQVSRTPVREALYRLEREGYLDVMFRSGWRVKPFDFGQFENLYDVRVILETAAVRKLCEMPERPPLEELKEFWLVPANERLTDGRGVGQYDEQFHETLVAATGNVEMARIHHDITERIRIIRRLDFTQADRIDATYQEHAKILRAVLQRKSDQAQLLLKTHIEGSKAEVRKITLHMLHTARPASS
jgi:DNA-binding GntR family transcriptional regulator